MRTTGRELEERVVKEAEYIIQNDASIRATAKAIGVSKTTVYNDMAHRLQEISVEKYKEIKKVLKKHKKECTTKAANARWTTHTQNKDMN